MIAGAGWGGNFVQPAVNAVRATQAFAAKQKAKKQAANPTYKTPQGTTIAMPTAPKPSTTAGGVDITTQLGAALKAPAVSYKPQTLNQYLPSNVRASTDATLGKLTNFNAQPVRLSSDYWNKTLQDTLDPMKREYEEARKTLRGDQAASGIINDSEGFNATGKLMNDYLTQVGAATRGVEIAREAKEAESLQWAQEQNLAGAQAAAGFGTNLAGLYGDIGTKERQFGTTAALQDKAAQTNLLSAALDYSTGMYGEDVKRYAAEMEGMSDIMGYDVERYKAEQESEDALRQRWIDYLELQGYGDEDYFTAVGAALDSGALNYDYARKMNEERKKLEQQQQFNNLWYPNRNTFASGYGGY